MTGVTPPEQRRHPKPNGEPHGKLDGAPRAKRPAKPRPAPQLPHDPHDPRQLSLTEVPWPPAVPKLTR
jgi:hypothetical protein